MPDDDVPSNCIQVKGARQNNLRNVDVDIPLNSLTVVTGVSGSGKSSLAFDTLYAEGQRRYVESLSAYARQFLERINRPQVDDISGLSPAIAIRQKNSSRNPRSTCGTATEIYDYLRLLYGRVGKIICRGCGRPVQRDTVDEIVDQLEALPQGTRLYICFPFANSLLDLHSEADGRRMPLEQIRENLLKQGFHRLILIGAEGAEVRQLADWTPSAADLDRLSILVDRLVVDEGIAERLADSVDTCYREGSGVTEAVVLADPDKGEPERKLRFTDRFECQYCQITYRRPEPRLFSFNNPFGACPTCQGFGNTITIDPDLVIPDPRVTLEAGPVDPFMKPRYRKFQKRLLAYAEAKGVPTDLPYQQLPEEFRRKVWEGDRGFPGVRGFFRYLERKKYKMHVRIFISRYRGYARCPDCGGERLCQEARDVYLGGKRITELTNRPISDVRQFFDSLTLSATDEAIAEKLLKEVRQRLEFLVKVGLDYLSLDRVTSTLSGGEMQRIQLAASLASSLVGTLYVLDEPSIGLHPRDESRLIEILKQLRDHGNTVLVVEHEKQMIEAADHIVDLGPGAGELGGKVMHSGTLGSLVGNPESLTGRYLAGQLKIPIPVFRRPANGRGLVIRGARQHNLKNIQVRIPAGVLTCITGVSGSGKSTLVQEILYPAVQRLKGFSTHVVGEHDSIEGWQDFTEIVLVDQAPIGKTPRSNPITYIKAFDDIRHIFAATREAKAHNFGPGHFSFNVTGGRCENCQGSGVVTVEMQFLADVELLCEECKGTRFKSKILEITYKGKNIAQVLDLTVHEALEFFKAHATLTRKLKVLQEIGLGYLRLGQPASTLSGGEAQRIKLSSYLSKPTSPRAIFVFDEPTTGLHFDDIHKLMRAFDKLLGHGATIVVIEHNLDVIKSADWIIDLGPEGGVEGGYLVAQGTPEEVARVEASYTGRFLRQVLGMG
ncbi:MAG: excinuclease ABC subunit UvrA [Acidobacteria bacterium]|nr:MAG: excinuclease ABC subunit UvrA [Acidobacteriota bacterium]